MDTVTYPHADVQRALGDHVLAAQFNTNEPNEQTKELMRRFRQVWTPTLIFLDHHEIELRRQVGYFPPEHLAAEVGLAVGAAHLMHGRLDQAYDQFVAVHRHHRQIDAGAEALFWSGVVALRRDGNADGLLRQWGELRDAYPSSPWWTKASFIDG